MFKLLLAASLCLVGLVSVSSSQNVEVLCKQLYTDCQACRVWDNECRAKPNRPSNKPTQPQRPEHPHTHPAPARPTESPAWPPPQNTQPAPAWPPQQQHQPQPQPSYPESPETSPAVVPTQPQHNCVKYGHWCKSDAECCTKNCRLELVSMGPEHPDQHFTQSVCR